jgi:hypothetical protein
MDREQLLIKARAIITQAPFTEEDRGMWYGEVAKMPIDALGLFIEIMSDPVLRDATNDSFKAKYAVKDDPHAMQLVLQQERENLTKLMDEDHNDTNQS